MFSVARFVAKVAACLLGFALLVGIPLLGQWVYSFGPDWMNCRETALHPKMIGIGSFISLVVLWLISLVGTFVAMSAIASQKER